MSINLKIRTTKPVVIKTTFGSGYEEEIRTTINVPRQQYFVNEEEVPKGIFDAFKVLAEKP